MKFWIWLKAYWKIPLAITIILVLGIATLAIFKGDGLEQIKKLLKITKDSYEEQIQVINHENVKEKKQAEKIVNIYKEEKEKIAKEYAKSKRKLEEEQKKDLSRLITEYHEDPDKLTQEIAKEFGIKYRKPK